MVFASVELKLVEDSGFDIFFANGIAGKGHFESTFCRIMNQEGRYCQIVTHLFFYHIPQDLIPIHMAILCNQLIKERLLSKAFEIGGNDYNFNTISSRWSCAANRLSSDP